MLGSIANHSPGRLWSNFKRLGPKKNKTRAGLSTWVNVELQLVHNWERLAKNGGPVEMISSATVDLKNDPGSTYQMCLV